MIFHLKIILWVIRRTQQTLLPDYYGVILTLLCASHLDTQDAAGINTYIHWMHVLIWYEKLNIWVDIVSWTSVLEILRWNRVRTCPFNKQIIIVAHARFTPSLLAFDLILRELCLYKTKANSTLYQDICKDRACSNYLETPQQHGCESFNVFILILIVLPNLLPSFL